jgi:hypothetical protein
MNCLVYSFQATLCYLGKTLVFGLFCKSRSNLSISSWWKIVWRKQPVPLREVADQVDGGRTTKDSIIRFLRFLRFGIMQTITFWAL